VIGVEHLPGGNDNLLVGQAHRVTGAEEAGAVLAAMASTFPTWVEHSTADATESLAGDFTVAPL
jgi:hypothetical protein